MDDAIEWARADGLTHLLHLDDDELLYLPAGRKPFYATLCSLPPSIFNVHALTLEAMVPSIGCQHPFSEARVFRHRPAEYSSYGSASHNAGKSIGVLRCRRLRCQGPHHYCKRRPVGCVSDSEKAAFDWDGTHILPAGCGVILHYESCSYERYATGM